MGRLTDLSVDEISAVDNPANAETVNGRKIPRAVIALWKRDNDEQVKQRTGDRKMKKQTFTEVLKSAETRDQVCVAVERAAEAIQKRDGISLERARVRAWTDEAMEKYERLPLPAVLKRERPMGNFTRAEARLEERARKRMRKTGCSYAKAISSELEEDPSLYESYEKEKATGDTFMAPQPVEYSAPALPSLDGNTRMLSKRGKKKLAPAGYADTRDDVDLEDDDEDEDDESDDEMADLELRDRVVKKCRNCNKGIFKGQNFCGHCGHHA